MTAELRAERRWSTGALLGMALLVASLLAPLMPNAGAAPRAVHAAGTLAVDVDGPVLTMARSGNTLFFGGQFSTVNGQPRLNLAAIDVTTGELTDFAPQLGGVPGDTGATALAVDDYLGTYVGGVFESLDGEARHNVAAVSSSWNPLLTDSGPGIVSALAVARTPEGLPLVYIGGRFDTVNGVPREGLAAIAGVGGNETVTDWNPGLAPDVFVEADALVKTLVLDRADAVIYVGGSFSAVGGQPRANVAAISTAGTGTPTAWNPGADGIVWALALDEPNEVVYATGGFSTLGGVARHGIGAVSTPGVGSTAPWSSDGPFGCGVGPSAVVLNPQRTEVVVGCTHSSFGSNLHAFASEGTGHMLRSYPAGPVNALAMTPAGRLFAGTDLGLSDFAPAAPVSLPRLAIATSSVEEGDAGARLARVTVSLSKAVPYQTAAYYQTDGWLASAGVDYIEKSGWVTIPAGSTSAAISVKVVGDTTVEHDERFSILLSNPQSARIQHGHGQVTITDDDRAPALRVGVRNAVVVEGDEDTRLARFTISLSRVSPTPVSVTYFTIPDTAAAGSDFAMRWAVATIPAGAMSTAATVPVIGDTMREEKERYTLRLIQPRGAILGRRNANGFILNDDRFSFSER